MLPGRPAAGGSMLSGYPGYTREMASLPVVKLRGIPFQCEHADVFEFFSGLEVVDVLLVRKEGRMTGEAFVLLASPMHAELALQRDKMYMGRRYVDVFRAKRADWYNAIANEVAEVANGGSFQDDGVPEAYQASMPQVSHVTYAQDDRPMYSAATAFSAAAPYESQLSAGGVYSSYSSGYSGGYSGARPSASLAGSVQAQVDATRGRRDRESKNTGVLKLRGLPFSASVQDILDFFSGLPLAEESVHIVCNGLGQSTGMAFAEFPTPEDAQKAMSRDKERMGKRYIELYPSSREEATSMAAKASTAQ